MQSKLELHYAWPRAFWIKWNVSNMLHSNNYPMIHLSLPLQMIWYSPRVWFSLVNPYDTETRIFRWRWAISKAAADSWDWHGLTLIPACISNCIHYKVWGEITYPFPNLNGCIARVWDFCLIHRLAKIIFRSISWIFKHWKIVHETTQQKS